MPRVTPLFALALACICPGRAFAAPLPRAVVPIRQTDLENGVIRYSIPIVVGGTRIDAMLDTGSTGIRILPGTLVPREHPRGHPAVLLVRGAL